jgi:hypothetical protein
VRLGSAGYLAVAYRGAAELDLAVQASIHGQADFFGALFPLKFDLATSSVTAYYPSQLDVGASLHPFANSTVDLDVTAVNWTGYTGSHYQTTSNALLSIPGGPSLTTGQSTSPAARPLAVADRVVPHVGVEYLIPGRAVGVRDTFAFPVRAGYLYDRSPLVTATPAVVDADRHVFSLGAGFVLNGLSAAFPSSLQVDLYGQVSVLPDRYLAPGSAGGGWMAGVGATVTVAF